MESRLKELAKYRFEKSGEDLEDAIMLLEKERYRLALNRSYYSIFHGMRAVNTLDGFDSSKHSGVIAHFNQFYVKEGKFPRETYKLIRSASEMREQADYEDFFIVSKQESEEQVRAAQKFYEEIKEFLINNQVLE